MIRTQIFLTDDEVRVLELESRQRKVTKSEIIRQAVDEYLEIRHVSKKQMLDAFKKSLGAAKGIDLEKRIKELRKHW